MDSIHASNVAAHRDLAPKLADKFGCEVSTDAENENVLWVELFLFSSDCTLP